MSKSRIYQYNFFGIINHIFSCLKIMSQMKKNSIKRPKLTKSRCLECSSTKCFIFFAVWKHIIKTYSDAVIINGPQEIQSTGKHAGISVPGGNAIYLFWRLSRWCKINYSLLLALLQIRTNKFLIENLILLMAFPGKLSVECLFF